MQDAISAESFSYADPSDPAWKRLVIHAVERATGQPYLRWLYESYRPSPTETFWDAAIRLLELKVAYGAEKLSLWPRAGSLVVVCNHPYGVLDGIVACHVVGKARPDFKVLTNAVICRAEELRPYLLPIDFSETPDALKTNLKSRSEAIAHLKGGGCILIFPAGGVSTTPKWWMPRAVDTEWKTFTAKLISQAHSLVAPLYFAGQNSSLFQLVSHVSLTLRLSLLFHEVHNKIGSEVHVVVGDVLTYDELAGIKDRQALMQTLRERTYALEAEAGSPPKTHVKRPRHAPPPGTLVPGMG